MARKSQVYLSHEAVEKKILFIRGKKVMMDKDLAELYQVPTKALIQAVKRNRNRFPGDFMYQLINKEVIDSRSQIVTLNRGQNIKYLPYAFTEQGVAMLSSVLNSGVAIQVNIHIIRTFVKIREFMFSHKDLELKIEQLENKYDQQLQVIFKALKALLNNRPDDKDGKRW